MNVLRHTIGNDGFVRIGSAVVLLEVLINITDFRAFAIQSGDNPKVIRERLLASLAQKQQKKLLAKAGAAGGDSGGGDK